MKSCGIIVEYNPFHNGHKYHAEQARIRSGADVVIAVMSGNFLQRGEPAIFDKWIRAEEALANGVDLVIELPFAYAVQAADYFAKGSIKLLQALHCNALCFGTDQQADFSYEKFGVFVNENQKRIDTLYQEKKNNGLNYPQQMTEVFRELDPNLQTDFTSPNHILGMSYAKENAIYPQPMTLHPLKREQAGYHDLSIYSAFASATAIRQATYAQQFNELSSVVPNQTLVDLSEQPLISWESYWPLLRYKLMTSSVLELNSIYQMTEGIEYRLKEAVKTANSFRSLLESMKTKRYTWTRLQRLACYILANVTKAEVQQVWQSSYIHVLGFNSVGQKFLKENKKTALLPIVTKISKSNTDCLALDIKIDQLYCLGDKKIKEQSFGRSPLRDLDNKKT